MSTKKTTSTSDKAQPRNETTLQGHVHIDYSFQGQAAQLDFDTATSTDHGDINITQGRIYTDETKREITWAFTLDFETKVGTYEIGSGTTNKGSLVNQREGHHFEFTHGTLHIDEYSVGNTVKGRLVNVGSQQPGFNISFATLEFHHPRKH